MTSRGIRNNNPGNIRHNKNVIWLGTADDQHDTEFVTFKSMEYGVRAIAKTLLTYYRKYHLQTVEGIINRWAPPNENNTRSYINFVAGRLNVEPNTPLNINDIEVMRGLVSGIINQENGTTLNKDVVTQGINLAYAT